MKSWLVRRKIDDDGGEMMIKKSDVELNGIDAIGEMGQVKHECTVAEIMTVVSKNSRGGNVGSTGNKEAREREPVVDKDKKIMLLPIQCIKINA